MKKAPIQTRCVFDSAGPEAGELVAAAFRLWLREKLREPTTREAEK